MNFLLASVIIILTVMVYICMQWLYRKVHIPIFVPVATTTLILITTLIMLNISYDTYMIGGKWIGELLGPAVVALAYPLYQHKATLIQYFFPIVTGVIVGSTVGVFSGLYMAILIDVDKEIILSIIPKSVTTPIAMDVADMVGGIPTLAAVFVTSAGIFGAMFGQAFLKVAKITDFVGIGVGFGTASHGIGTARVLEIGRREAAVSSIAMILSALYVAIVCPIIISFLI